jgi:hypothetical protein
LTRFGIVASCGLAALLRTGFALVHTSDSGR